MSENYCNEVRAFLVEFLEEYLTLKGYSVEGISDDFDLLTRGAIDSLGFLELMVALQEEFNVELDFDEINPEELSIVGPLCHYITRKKNESPMPRAVLDFTDIPEPEQCASEILAGIHDAGNPFYDWFYGGYESARMILGKMITRPSSEISLNRVKVQFCEGRSVGGFLCLSGAELLACCKADMFALMREKKSDGLFDLSERFTATRALFFRVEPDVYYLSKMWINPDFRGKGFGREILHGFLEEGRAAGFKAFQLDVSADNQPALNLYRSCGFQVLQKSCFPRADLEYFSMRLED